MQPPNGAAFVGAGLPRSSDARTCGQAVSRPRPSARLAAPVQAARRAGGPAVRQRVHRGLHHGQHRGGAL